MRKMRDLYETEKKYIQALELIDIQVRNISIQFLDADS